MTEREIKLLAKEIVAEQMRYEVVGADEAARILGIATSTLYNKMKEIPHGRFGKGEIRFRKADLFKLVMR